FQLSDHHVASEIQSQPAVALLQRAIPHYRFPLFKKLAENPRFKWIFYCAEHDQEISTGLPSPHLQELNIKPIRNLRLWGPFFYQAGVKLNTNQLGAFMCDLGWTLTSTPRYLVEARLRGIATIGWSKGIPQNPNARES